MDQVVMVIVDTVVSVCMFFCGRGGVDLVYIYFEEDDGVKYQDY